MKLSGNKIQTEYTPLKIAGNLIITGGPAVQFFDGVNYVPNRAGTPSSPILVTHDLSAVDPDGILTSFQFSTLFYENDTLITSSTSGYTLTGANAVRVEKNIPAGTSVVIKAVSELLDSRSGKVYRREDTTYLRTLLKSEAPYQMELSQRGVVYFDAYRNPNTTTTVTAVLKKDGADLSDYTGIIFKWLNPDGLDVVENELYADAYSNGNRTLTVDKTYIDHELIRCEAWIGSEMVAFDTVTFVRKFNSFRADVHIPENPIQPGVSMLNCSIDITDVLGNVDVNAAFLVTWMVTEGGVSRQLATGTPATIPASSINLKASPEIWVDLKRREAFAALTTDDPDELLTDDDDNVLTVETFGL